MKAWEGGVTQVLRPGGSTSGGNHSHGHGHGKNLGGNHCQGQSHGHGYCQREKSTILSLTFIPNIAGQPVQRTWLPRKSCQRTPASL